MGPMFYFVSMIMLGIYFMFAAVQGDYGVFKRAEIAAAARALTSALERLPIEIAEMERLTTRFSHT